MKITIIGAGNAGGALGVRWAKAGHQVLFAVRDPQGQRVTERLQEAGGNASAGPIEDAADAADVIVLATPWNASQNVLSAIGDMDGKPLVDCTNPLNAAFTGLELGHTTSAAEQIAAWAPTAHVVKAFNSVSAAVMADPQFGDERPALFYCGDDESAKQVVCQLAKELGFDPVDAGDLQIARFLEPMAMLYIKAASKNGWGGNCAFKILRR